MRARAAPDLQLSPAACVVLLQTYANQGTLVPATRGIVAPAVAPSALKGVCGSCVHCI